MNIKIYMLLLCLSIIALGRVDAKSNNPDDVVIEGRVLDNFTKTSKHKVIEVTILISEFATSGMNFRGRKFLPEVDQKTGKFRQVIPAISDRFYMYIYFTPVGTENWTFIPNVYILEKGDRLNCELSSRYYKFTGKGATRLQCQSDIYSQKLPHKSQSTQDADSLLNIRLKIIEDYSKELGLELTNIMIANCYGLRDFLWLREYAIKAKVNRSDYDYAINSERFKKLEHKNLNSIQIEHLVQAPIYVDYLYCKIVLESNIVNDWKSSRADAGANFVYNRILNNYNGLIREKLLVIFFLHNKISSKFLDEGLQIVQSKDYRKILLDLKETYRNDKPFYNFKLKDDKGNWITLDHFKDKVVVMDFWFTGCTGCKMLNEAMVPIVKKYRDNPKLAFVSVSIDKERSAWLKSVATGNYTHPESINLYAGVGKGNNARHPLIEHYKIKSYPTLFIIKNGNMFEAKPTIPISSPAMDGTLTDNTKTFISLLDSALK